ncbi:Superoxide dismutase [Cu-Zn] [Frankliniella fusca]|uniref:Superoxide dismutase [Cu-Zn] n=1 Tax=Frankliniella fusca TaxID=407009 RepID=A0AAE1LQG8_9NEOP|nr:Superoxide dismutase [Cu-Zn] [Frankliniella fusca]
MISQTNDVTSTVNADASLIAPSGAATSDSTSNSDIIVLDYSSAHLSPQSMEEKNKAKSKVSDPSSKSVNDKTSSKAADWNISGIDPNAEKQLKSLLPAEFNHAIEAVQPYCKIDSAITAVVRLPMTTQEEALEWLEHFQASSFTDFRSLKTWPQVTKDKVLFKKQFRCHHNTYPNFNKSKKHHAKHVKCPAQVMITIKNMDMNWTRVISFQNQLCPFLLKVFFMFLPAELNAI